METLYSYNRILRGGNYMAYRLQTPRPGAKDDNDVIQRHDHDSDGENGAGSNMQWLLETMGAQNAMVVVTRWCGGTKLGPARFRHINNLTREIVEHYCATTRPAKSKSRALESPDELHRLF